MRVPIGHFDHATPAPDSLDDLTAPVADAGPDQTVAQGDPIVVDGSGSRDPDGTIMSYAWTFGDGGTASGMTASQCSALLLTERNARAKADRARRHAHDIITMVAHELRAPLHAILGWTELMLAHQQDRQLLIRGLGIVACNARLQEHLIDDLMDIVRLSSGRYRLDLQSVHLPSIVESAVEMVRPAASAKMRHGNSCDTPGSGSRP